MNRLDAAGKYVLGLDYGTLSVRALLLNIETGEETSVSVFEYPHGVMDSQLPGGEKLPSDFALQYPEDYLDGLKNTVCSVMQKSGICPEQIAGIGIDFTSSTILPVNKDAVPLCFLEEFRSEPHAYVKLWKHHGGEAEAVQIDELAKECGEKWHSIYGGKVSGEWMMPKILETIHYAPHVYRTADYYIEALDWLVWKMTGQLTLSECMAGYKAFYHEGDGYPGADFFGKLSPEMEQVIADKMSAPLKKSGEIAGYLSDEMAQFLGLRPGIPVASGMIDAHASVLGSGICEPGTMMVIVGTSSCHMILSETENGIPGVGGLVKDGILPGYFGYEAGQSCVGDHFEWFVQNCVPAAYKKEAEQKGIGVHQLLEEKLKGYRAGQSGLLALDWFNGVRSPLMDFNLNGLILGMNLQTKPEEIYLALIEATAYGTRMILDSFEEAGIPVDSIVLGGGIPKKNRMLVQVYSDVCNRTIRICGSSNASARGAAILGAAAGKDETGFANVAEAVKQLGSIQDEVFAPDPENARIYKQLYAEYKTLHDYFGKGGNDVMKRLNAMRRR